MNQCGASYYSFTRETFSWTNMTLSTVAGARELRLAFIVNPASEKILSDGALVAGMASFTYSSRQFRQGGIHLLL